MQVFLNRVLWGRVRNGGFGIEICVDSHNYHYAKSKNGHIYPAVQKSLFLGREGANGGAVKCDRDVDVIPR